MFASIRRPGSGLTALLVVVLLGLSGCQTMSRIFTPKRAALAEVHEVYRTEFAETFLTGGTSSSGCEPEGGRNAFPETLRAIRAYRVENPGAERELAHLTVLEAMIYVQSGSPGMAVLVRDQVLSARSQLRSGTGHYTRDGLFADNFEGLVDGWTAVCNSLPDENRGSVVYEAPGAYSNPAATILTNLDNAKEDLADPESDEGAIYLATSAATFFVWAHVANKEKCVFRSNEACDEPALEEKSYLKKAKAAIEPHLSESEKRLAGAAGASPDASPGRIRYVLWYSKIKELLAK